MVKALDKLVQDSCAGCISDLKDIEGILDRMGKMTWGDLVDLADAKTGENGLILIKAALEVGYDADMPDERIRELGLPEALSLVNKENYISWENPDLQNEGDEVCEDFGEDWEEIRMDFEEGEEHEDCGGFEEDGKCEGGANFGEDGECEDCVGFGEDGEEICLDLEKEWEEICLDSGEDGEYEKTPRYHQSGKERLEGNYCNIMALLVHMLTEVRKTSNLFRMFFGISINALFKYRDKLDRDKLPEEEADMTAIFNPDIADFCLTAQKLGVSIDSRTTIGDIFRKADDIRRTAWRPSEPIEEYRDRILDAYELYKAPLFDIFKAVFPRRFDPQQIIGDDSYQEIG